MPYPDENIARDQAKAEYELALYKAGKKAAEVVEQYLQKNPDPILVDEEAPTANMALKLLAVIEGVALPPE